MGTKATSNNHQGSKSSVLDLKKLTSLSLLQSIYVETLRVHLSMNIMREVMEPTTIDGYNLRPGALCFLPMEVAHRDETWAIDGHPASEFWAERHVKTEEEVGRSGKTMRKPVFHLAAGVSGAFFPYGKPEFPSTNWIPKSA